MPAFHTPLRAFLPVVKPRLDHTWKHSYHHSGTTPASGTYPGCLDCVHGPLIPTAFLTARRTWQRLPSWKRSWKGVNQQILCFVVRLCSCHRCASNWRDDQALYSMLKVLLPDPSACDFVYMMAHSRKCQDNIWSLQKVWLDCRTRIKCM